MVRIRMVQRLRSLDLVNLFAERYFFLYLNLTQLVCRLRVSTGVVQVPIVQDFGILARLRWIIELQRRRLQVLLHFKQLRFLNLLIQLVDLVLVVRVREGGRAQMIIITGQIFMAIFLASERRQLLVFGPLMLLHLAYKVLLATFLVLVDHVLRVFAALDVLQALPHLRLSQVPY